MRQMLLVGFGLGALFLMGCLRERSTEHSSLIQRLRPFGQSPAPNTVVLEYALVETPYRDPYLDHEVWNALDEQILPVECKALLRENGLRVGQVGGILPAGLHTLLTSERSCVNPRHLQFRSGSPTVLALQGPLPSTELRLTQQLGKAPTVVPLEQAQFGLEVTPELLSDGRLKLRFVPAVQHGEKRHWLQNPLTSNNLSGQGQRAVERYATLAWDWTVSPNEYLMIGAIVEAVGTWGERTFVVEDGPRKLQRALVLRVGRVDDGGSPLPGQAAVPRASLSLASQASGGLTVRSARP